MESKLVIDAQGFGLGAAQARTRSPKFGLVPDVVLHKNVYSSTLYEITHPPITRRDTAANSRASSSWRRQMAACTTS